MGLVDEMKKKSKKELFFEEVLKLIYKKGFKATTMRDIAQKMNFEVANVYNYIDSKQSLLEIYLFGISEEFNSSMDQIIDSSYTPKEKLRLIISNYVQITARSPYQQALLVNEWRNIKEPRLKEFIKNRKNYEDKLKMVVQEGMINGQFRTNDLEFTTNIILASLRWVYHKYIDVDKKPNTIELEKQLTDFVFLGIGNN